MKKIDPIHEGLYPIETLAKGTFVKFKDSSKRVFIVNGYSREAKRYSLTAFDDINHETFVKRGRKLFAGFVF